MPLEPGKKTMAGSLVILSLLSLLSGSVGVAAVEDRQVRPEGQWAASGSEVSVHVGHWEGGARLELPAGKTYSARQEEEEEGGSPLPRQSTLQASCL